MIEVCSNGALLHRVDDAIFRAIDKLSISWYPDDRCGPDKIDLARRKCLEHGVQLKVERIERFRTMQQDTAIGDANLVKRIFQSCQIAHSWGCQTFLDGRFYLCSRPLFLPESGGPKDRFLAAFDTSDELKAFLHFYAAK